MKRKAKISRKTKETSIAVDLNIDGKGKYKIDTGIGFLDHMLEQLSKHSSMDMNIKAKGDIEIDYHHLVEDMGLTLGQAFKDALSDKAGIKRYGFFILPMDETLVTVALDLSNRAFLVFDAATPVSMVRDFNILLFKENVRVLI